MSWTPKVRPTFVVYISTLDASVLTFSHGSSPPPSRGGEGLQCIDHVQPAGSQSFLIGLLVWKVLSHTACLPQLFTRSLWIPTFKLNGPPCKSKDYFTSIHFASLHTFTCFDFLSVYRKDQFEKSSSRTQSGADDIIISYSLLPAKNSKMGQNKSFRQT